MNSLVMSNASVGPVALHCTFPTVMPSPSRGTVAASGHRVASPVILTHTALLATLPKATSGTRYTPGKETVSHTCVITHKHTHTYTHSHTHFPSFHSIFFCPFLATVRLYTYKEIACIDHCSLMQCPCHTCTSLEIICDFI